MSSMYISTIFQIPLFCKICSNSQSYFSFLIFWTKMNTLFPILCILYSPWTMIWHSCTFRLVFLPTSSTPWPLHLGSMSIASYISRHLPFCLSFLSLRALISQLTILDMNSSMAYLSSLSSLRFLRRCR